MADAPQTFTWISTTGTDTSNWTRLGIIADGAIALGTIQNNTFSAFTSDSGNVSLIAVATDSTLYKIPITSGSDKRVLGIQNGTISPWTESVGSNNLITLQNGTFSAIGSCGSTWHPIYIGVNGVPTQTQPIPQITLGSNNILNIIINPDD